MMVSPSVLTSFLVFFSGVLARPATMVSATDLACPSELENMERLNFRANLFYAIVPGVGEESGILCARYEYRGVGFVAMAVSESGSMIGSEAIIGLMDDGDDGTGTVMKYFLGGKDTALVQPVEEAKQTLMDTSITQDDDATNPMTIMTFTKYLKEEDEREILENGMNQFIWAYGGANNLAYHSNRKGKFQIDFKVTKAPTEAPVTASPTVSTPPTMAPTQSPSMAPTPAPTKNPVVSTMPPTPSPITDSPTMPPTTSPTMAPTTSPTMAPTTSPTMAPTTSPTMSPTKSPTMSPVAMAEVPPTLSPTASPTTTPTKAPVVAVPTLSPVASADSPPTISPVTGAVTDAPVMGAVTESPVKAGAFAMRGGSVMVGVAATIVAAWML